MPSPLLTPERITVLQALHTANHPWAVRTIANADGAPLENWGIWDLLAYHMTGTTGYRDAAITKYLAAFPENPENRNMSREYSWVLALMHMWLESHFSGPQLATSAARLDTWGEDMLGLGEAGHFTAAGDSDEVSCHMMGLLLIDMANGDTHFQDITETGQGSLNVTQMLSAFANFLALADGGEWIEGAEYNLGTLQLILPSAMAIGIGEFTGLEAWLDELNEQLRWLLTKGYTKSCKYGDLEHPGDPLSARRLPLLCMSIAASGDPTGKTLNYLGNYYNTVSPPLGDQYNLWRALLVFDPRDIPASPTTDDMAGLRSTLTGVGIEIYKRGQDHIEFYGANPTGVHHEPSGTSLRWAIGEEFVVEFMQGYVTTPHCLNTPLMAGLPFMFDRGLVSSEEISGGWQAVFHTEGIRYDPGYFDPPAAFGELTRTVTFMDGPRTLTVTDEFEGDEPAESDRWQGDDQWFVDNHPRLTMQLWHFPHAASIPVAVDGGYRITFASGKVLDLATDAPNKRVDSVAGGSVVDSRYNKEVGSGIATNGYLQGSEYAGWLIQLGSDATPTATITTSFSEAGFITRRSLRRLLRRR